MVANIAHVLVPGDPVGADSRSAVLMVARELVAAHQANGTGAQLIASRGCVTPTIPPTPAVEVMRGAVPQQLLSRGRSVVEGRVLGHRPHLARAFVGLESLTGYDATVIHNIPEGLRSAPAEAARVLYLHNDALRRYSRREVASLARVTDLVVSVSAALAERIPAELSTSIAVIHNGVNSELFSPRRTEVPAPPTILYCGRVVPIKGVHVLLSALRRLTHHSFQVRIVGSGSNSRSLSRYERRLRRDAATDGLEGRVSFERQQPRAAIPEIMRRSEVLVVPSVWSDPCPLVVLEGMASGLAVLGSDVGGIPELGGDALRYHSPGDVETLTEHLDHLLSQPGFRRQMGVAARERAQGFTWARAETQLTQAVLCLR